MSPLSFVSYFSEASSISNISSANAAQNFNSSVVTSIDQENSATFSFVYQGTFENLVAESDKPKSELLNVIRPQIRFYPAGYFVDRMLDYEGKYGIKSSTFYRLYCSGLMERNKDFSDWAIIYKNFVRE